MKPAHQRSTKMTESHGGDYSGGTRKTIAKASHDSLGSVGAARTVAGNTSKGMGVGSGKSVSLDQGAMAGLTSGRARTNKGRNKT